MPASPETSTPRRRSIAPIAALVALAATAAITTGIALAAGSPRLKTASNAAVGATIVVDSSSRTVYELSPETSTHLLCTSQACMSIWPPVTVPSRKTKLTAAKGVKGKLGILKRSNGLLQLTLGGRPLYRFAPDANKNGAAGGNGINSFGGHWHVVKASSRSAGTNTNNNTSTNPTGTTPGYMTPGY